MRRPAAAYATNDLLLVVSESCSRRWEPGPDRHVDRRRRRRRPSIQRELRHGVIPFMQIRADDPVCIRREGLMKTESAGDVECESADSLLPGIANAIAIEVVPFDDAELS